jgi:hypothetical protein
MGPAKSRHGVAAPGPRRICRTLRQCCAGVDLRLSGRRAILATCNDRHKEGRANV